MLSAKKRFIGYHTRLIAVAVLCSACGGGGGVSPTAPTPVSPQKTITSFSTSASRTTLAIGQWATLAATAVYSDDTSAQIPQIDTLGVEWVSNDVSVAGIEPSQNPWDGWNQVRAKAPGTTSITATYGGRTASVSITVTPTRTVVGWIGNLLQEGWIENAVVRIGNTAAVTSDANGRFEVAVEQTGIFPVVIQANGFHASESEIEVQSSLTIARRDLLTTNTDYFDLAFFDHVFRDKGTRGTRRWVATPTVEIWAKEMKCLETNDDGKHCLKFEATGTATPSEFETTIRSVVGSDIPSLTNDVMSGISVTTIDHAAGTILELDSCGQPNKIKVVYMTAGTTDFSGRYSYAASCSYSSGEMVGSEVHMAWTDDVGTYRHELAHTLGWSHPDGYDSIPRPSVMNLDAIITAWDTKHGKVLYRRAAGSTSPDKDPSGKTINDLQALPWTLRMGPNLHQNWPALASGRGGFRGPLIAWIEN